MKPIIITVIIIAAAALCTFVAAEWDVQWNGKKPAVMPENVIGGSYLTRQRITATTPRGFKSTMATDRSLFPGKCNSDNPDSPYGWQRFRDELLPVGGVSVTYPRLGGKTNTRVIINLQPRMGFSTPVPELISCGPLEDADGNGYWLDENTPVDEKYIKFTIDSSKEVSFVLFKSVNVTTRQYVETVGAMRCPTYRPSSQEVESTFRSSGFKLELVLNNDVWVEERIPDLAGFITCSPGDCLKGLIQKTDLFYDSNVPNVVTVFVPRERMRGFNIDRISTVAVQLAEPRAVYGSKGRYINAEPASTSYQVMTVPAPEYNSRCERESLRDADSPRITIGMHQGLTNRTFPALFPLDATNNIMNVTEDCVRGKVADEAACPRAILFIIMRTLPGSQIFRLSRTKGLPYLYDDLRKYTFSSAQGFPFADFEWVEPGGFKVERDRFNYNLKAVLQMRPLPEYETTQLDVITVDLPFSAFRRQEPPISKVGRPMQIWVTPSPGTFVGELRDIEQREIWFSQVVIKLVLDGESWKESVLDTAVLVDSYGSIGFGWDAQKAFLISQNGTGVSFEKTNSSLGVNRTTVVITLAQNPDYEMVGGTEETVSFRINTTWIRSGLPLQIAANTSFRIIGSPGTYTLDAASTTVEESEIRTGGFTLTLQLAGQKFVQDITLCKLALCASWTTNSTDTSGFVARRPILCNPQGITRVNNRTVTMVFFADKSYDTIRGENITTMVPGACTGGVSPAQRHVFRILPQNGNVTVQMSTNGTVGRYNATRVSESLVRNGLVTLYLSLVNDTWDSANANFSTDLQAALVSNTEEPVGWNNKKGELIESITIIDPALVEIKLRRTTTYDIIGNETIGLTIPPTWVSSGRAPVNPRINFTIFASAGDVTLMRWSGGSGGNDVTEEDLRWGRVWFELSLLGDQFRRDRTPFVSSFSSDQLDVNTSLARLIPQLVPSIRFFQFSLSLDGSETLRLQLQSSALFDVSSTETVTLRFVENTVVSGIAPTFFVNGQQAESFTFRIRATPGRVILSGAVDALNEKKMRQSGELKIYLTLVGETWNIKSADNTTTALIENVNAIPNPERAPAAGGGGAGAGAGSGGSGSGNAGDGLQPNGFVSFKASILSKNRLEFLSPQVLLLHFLPNRNYEITEDEWLEMVIPSYCTSSGFTPVTRSGQADGKLRLVIQPTGGELRLEPPDMVVEEEDLRSSNFTVVVSVDGDQWAQTNILDRAIEFVATGFASTSSIIQEAHGFSSLKEQFLNIGRNKRPFVSSGSSAGQESTLRVLLNPELTYDINKDEQIRFSVSNPEFLQTGLPPDPATVTFTVRAKPRVVVLLIDQTLPKSLTYRNNLFRLDAEINRLLGVPLSRFTTELNATAVRDDGLLVVLLTFVPATTQKLRDADPRSLQELQDTLLSINADHLYKSTAIRFAYMRDAPPAADTLVVRPPTPAPPPPAIDTGSDYMYILAIVGCIFIGVIAVGFVVGLRMQRARVAMSALKSSRQRRRDESAVDFHDDAVMRREQAIELSVNPRLRGAGLKVPGSDLPDHFDGPLVARPATSLRAYVRSTIGVQGPESHISHMRTAIDDSHRRHDEIVNKRRANFKAISRALHSASAITSPRRRRGGGAGAGAGAGAAGGGTRGDDEDDVDEEEEEDAEHMPIVGGVADDDIELDDDEDYNDDYDDDGESGRAARAAPFQPTVPLERQHSPLHHHESAAGAADAGTRQFHFRNREQLKHLNRLMDI